MFNSLKYMTTNFNIITTQLQYKNVTLFIKYYYYYYTHIIILYNIIIQLPTKH